MKREEINKPAGEERTTKHHSPAPQSDQYLNSLGAILHRAGRTDEALKHLTELDRRLENPHAEANSSPSYIWYFLALAYQTAGNEEQAHEYLDKANQWTDQVTLGTLASPAT